MVINSHALRKGIRNPRNALRYIRHRVRDVRNDHVTFDTASVTGGAIDPPVYSYDLYLETEALMRSLEGVEAGESLEVGCGYGRLTPWIASASASHYAIDPNESLLDLASEYRKGVDFRRCLVQDMPFSDDRFDLIVSWTVLMHVPQNEVEAAINEIKRAAAPGSTIVLSEATAGAEGVKRAFSRPVEWWEKQFSEYTLALSFERDVDHRSIGENESQHVMKFVHDDKS